MITRELQERLTAGAQQLRENPDAIDHARLVGMVADWLDGEALMYELTERFVEVIQTIEVSGQRACEVSLVELPGNRLATHGDTSSHAERIIAALPVGETGAPIGTPRTSITPEEIGPARYGVHLFPHEDGWGWTAYGHPETRRLIAAISAEARELGVHAELYEFVETVSFLVAGIERKWATNFRSGAWYDVEWEWCEADTPGAVPMTVVNP